ncbi:hypothetical protein [Leptospira meyeri]|uniref:hypothetical protein n=1 Tax=Leptospira meyeri TaxID=29508 RepID=UPI000C2B1F90|nr:hypothetical protein [Leptospira meyeri]PJZ82679.1 hypothetical protein CH359_01620 [Leptospira meyeri]PJZ98082.1 hypothetical protein CH358_03755 [Leptospira meyeri]PKA10406.1 hypothetical protein CH372_19575 [Leptospira meyeri]
MKIQFELNVLDLVKKIHFVLLKICNFINRSVCFSLLAFVACTNGTGLYDDRLIKLGDAEKDIRILFIAKQLELFPGSTIISDLKLSANSSCNRDVYYDKSDFRRCISNLALQHFNSKDTIELSLEFRYYVDTVCDLKKIIMFGNSVWGGEVNLCELN